MIARIRLVLCSAKSSLPTVFSSGSDYVFFPPSSAPGGYVPLAYGLYSLVNRVFTSSPGLSCPN